MEELQAMDTNFPEAYSFQVKRLLAKLPTFTAANKLSGTAKHQG
jgi:hypothetical protein